LSVGRRACRKATISRTGSRHIFRRLSSLAICC
jgi:hypothetical protein